MSFLLLGEKGCGYRFYRDTEWDISADMKNIFLSYRGATAELIRILTVKFKIPGDTDNVSPLNPHPREKKKRSFPPRCCYRCSALRNPTRLFFYLAFTYKTGSGRRRRKKKIKDDERSSFWGGRYETDIRSSGSSSSFFFFPPRPSIRRAVRTSLTPAPCIPVPQQGEERKKVAVVVVVVRGVRVWGGWGWWWRWRRWWRWRWWGEGGWVGV